MVWYVDKCSVNKYLGKNVDAPINFLNIWSVPSENIIRRLDPFSMEIKVYWKEKETHIHFGYYFIKVVLIVCKNLCFKCFKNIHICTHCDTFLSKETTCVSHVNGKGDRGNERKIHVVLNNRKNWFFKCPGFG